MYSWCLRGVGLDGRLALVPCRSGVDLVHLLIVATGQCDLGLSYRVSVSSELEATISGQLDCCPDYDSLDLPPAEATITAIR